MPDRSFLQHRPRRRTSQSLVVGDPAGLVFIEVVGLLGHECGRPRPDDHSSQVLGSIEGLFSREVVARKDPVLVVLVYRKANPTLKICCRSRRQVSGSEQAA